MGNKRSTETDPQAAKQAGDRAGGGGAVNPAAKLMQQGDGSAPPSFAAVPMGLPGCDDPHEHAAATAPLLGTHASTD